MTKILTKCIDCPKTTLTILLLLTLFFGYQLKNLRMETDAEAMLPENHPAIIYNDLVKEIFRSKDVVIVSIFDEGDSGIFHRETLELVEHLTEKIKDVDGVIAKDIMSLSTIKNIIGTQEGFEVSAFMETVPESSEEIDALKRALYENDIYIGSIVSRDGKATSIFVKLEEGIEKRTQA